jgi:hypothetical protein
VGNLTTLQYRRHLGADGLFEGWPGETSVSGVHQDVATRR